MMKTFLLFQMYFDIMITCNNTLLLKLRSQIDLKTATILSRSQTKSKSALLVKTTNATLK